MDYQQQMTQRRREAMARQITAFNRLRPVKSDLRENLQQMQKEWERRELLTAALGIIGLAIGFVALVGFAFELGLL